MAPLRWMCLRLVFEKSATARSTLISGAVFLLVLRTHCKASGEDVFASSAHLKILEDGERHLIEWMRTFIGREQEKLDALKRLFGEVEGKWTPLATSDGMRSAVHHPVEVFHLIHRFTFTWRKQIFSVLDNGEGLQELKDKVNAMEDILPTEDDYNGAKSAILRLQRTYKLRTSDVINGTIMDQTTRPMSQQMAVDVALFALSRGLTSEALEWLTHAQDHHIPPLTPTQEIYHTNARIYALRGEFLRAADFTRKALELDPSNGLYLSKIMPDGTEIKHEWPLQSTNHHVLCRELVKDSFRNTRKSSLSCSFRRGTRIPFLSIKLEYLNRSPDVVIFHDFISDPEGVELQTIVKSKMQRATVGNTLQSYITDGRVGKIAWMFDGQGEPLVNRLSVRISDATGLETRYPSGEPLQLSNYGLGGHYDLHFDHDELRYQRTVLAPEIVQAGDRMATLMIYLNSVEAGGATVFPELNLGIRPIKNAAIFWYNYKKSGFPDPKSIHAACPVLIGEKWVANKWIREFGQEFRRSCDPVID